jgi:nucleoside-diphosphate-sugar epimerase
LNILITGATGFIGSRLVKRLAEEGSHQLYAIVRKTSKVDFLKKLGVNLIFADLADYIPGLSSLCNPGMKIDAVFHCAAYVNDRDWDRLYKANVIGTENICGLALKLGVERMVYLSSVAVVSGNPQVPLTEELPYSATNLYGLSKIEAEKKVLEYKELGLNTVILRPCMVYGEGEPHLMGLLLFFLKHRLLPIIGEGKNKMHLAYVGNVIDAMILSLQKSRMLSGSYFVADDEVLTVKEILSILSRAVNGREPAKMPYWAVSVLLKTPFINKRLQFFQKDRVYDISRIKSEGFNARFHAEDSLAKSAGFWLKPKNGL